MTAFAVSPMELIRVRVQGSAAPAGVSYTQQLISTVRNIHAQGEVSPSFCLRERAQTKNYLIKPSA